MMYNILSINLNSMGQNQCCEATPTPNHLLNPTLTLKFPVYRDIFRIYNKILSNPLILNLCT